MLLAMTFLAILLSGFSVALAILHLSWAFEIWVPYRTEAPLVRAVVGFDTATRMPGPIPCVLIAVGLVLAAIAPWWAAGGWMATAIASVAAATFLVRGFLPYLPIWRRIAKEEPFASLDRKVYGPLGLALGIGFLVVAIH